MSIVDKVTRTRYTLKEVLKEEWDTSVMPDLSNSEIEKLYTLPSSKNKQIAQFGVASACNFSLNHKYIPSYRIHVIYYNFPEIGKSSSKITKSSCDKIESLYSSEIISPHDSVIMIVNDIISESLQTSFDTLNIKLQNDLETIELDDKVIDEMKKSKFPLEKKHFRNVTLFYVNNLTNNIMTHRLVPEQIVVRDRQEIKNILEETNCNTKQLPIILKGDIISKYLRLSPGDICKIKRKSVKTGEYYFYRICH
jgi:DNA-directed RNA polymerase subunit H (RpoH/RPB5)